MRNGHPQTECRVNPLSSSHNSSLFLKCICLSKTEFIGRAGRPSKRNLTHLPETGNETILVRSTDAHGTRPSPDFERRNEPTENLKWGIRNPGCSSVFRHGDSRHLYRFAANWLAILIKRMNHSSGTYVSQSPHTSGQKCLI